jgi:hypothetical protein
VRSTGKSPDPFGYDEGVAEASPFVVIKSQLTFDFLVDPLRLPPLLDGADLASGWRPCLGRAELHPLVATSGFSLFWHYMASS